MKSYKVYLSRSHEAVGLIARGFSAESGTGNVKYTRTGYGCTDAICTIIPAEYQDDGLFYAFAEWEDNGPAKYELTVC